MSQPDLFSFSPMTAPSTPSGASLEEKFWAFHQANPQVYEMLREMSLRMKRAGFRRYSIATMFEALRWQYHVATESDDGFRLNNNYRAFYARLLMEQEPELRGFFETRTQTHTLPPTRAGNVGRNGGQR